MNGMDVAQITVDNGPMLQGRYVIEQEWIPMRSEIATTPDMGWELIDDAGHFHAYDTGKELPTLVTRPRHIDCDGSCGGVCEDQGYDVVEYFCRICDQHIQPGTKPQREWSIPGMKSWRAEVITTDGPLPRNGLVSVRIAVDDKVLFGVAHVGSWSGEENRNGSYFTTQLFGASPLGTRRHATASAHV